MIKANPQSEVRLRLAVKGTLDTLARSRFTSARKPCPCCGHPGKLMLKPGVIAKPRVMASPAARRGFARLAQVEQALNAR
jgi:hypothetical protein